MLRGILQIAKSLFNSFQILPPMMTYKKSIVLGVYEVSELSLAK